MTPAGDLRAEFTGRHARADFFLQRQAAFRSIHDAHGADPINALCDSAERESELVHHEAGIHAGAYQRDAFFSCRGVQLLRKLGMLAERVGELFAGGNDAASRRDTLEQLIHHAGEIRRGRMDDQVCRTFQATDCASGKSGRPKARPARRQLRRDRVLPSRDPYQWRQRFRVNLFAASGARSRRRWGRLHIAQRGFSFSRSGFLRKF